MAIQRIEPEDTETFSLHTNPVRHYVSGATGVEGKLHVFARRSDREKDVVPTSFFSGSSFTDHDLAGHIRVARAASLASGSNVVALTTYLADARDQPTSVRKQQQVDVIRFVPGVSFDSDTQRKAAVTNALMPYYRATYPGMHFGYTNYSCLNFFSNEAIPSGSALLYANPITSSLAGVVTGPYVPTGSFAFDFWINPRYSTTSDTGSYTAGTILHLSSCYAVSLVTGSSRDANGLPDGFRVLLQLSSSTDTRPSHLSLGSLSQLNFVSDDNSLSKNRWHHVTVRWGTNSYNMGSGSFVVDGNTKGPFAIPSASIVPSTFSPSRDNATVLVVGNYYEGTNTASSSLAYFFSTDTATREGLEELIVDAGFAPSSYRFDHPLQAEIHDLKLYGRMLHDAEIEALRTSGPISDTDLLFYLPPFFTQEAPTRTHYLSQGGVLETPFFTFDGTTTTPFGAEMAFSVGGHYPNLENHTRDFATGKYPRLWCLTSSVGDAGISEVPQTANQLLYATGSVRKRALTVLPCDNGTFYPNFTKFLGGLDASRFVNDLGNRELGTISLRHVIPTGSIATGLRSEGTGSIAYQLSGPDPSLSASLTRAPGEVYTILQRTRDDSSNQVVFFDISNLYYGDRIKPGSLTLSDMSVSGSGGQVKVTLQDDGRGNLHRANATGSHPTWASVGNVFYNEGVVLLKDPSLYFFGESGFVLDFAGEHNIHVQRLTLTAHPYEHVSSSNPSYIPVSASDMANDTDKRFVYVTGVNTHDDNLNVVMRTTLAQPVVLRSGDKMSFVVKMDW